MFKNEKIECNQEWNNEKVNFDVDSSPRAWEHYRMFYSKKIKENYDFDRLFYYTHYRNLEGIKCGYITNGVWYNYANQINNTKNNRLYALHTSAKKETEETDRGKIEWCGATRRLGGECDFNFNEKKYELFKQLIENNEQAKIQLDRCKEMHHTFLNFSLMEAIGGMQSFKGENKFDRLDTFIYELDRYLSGISRDILSSSSEENRGFLKNYLDDFKDIYEYCKEMYFIDEKTFVDEIIESGRKPIKNCSDVIRYMSLAEKFWAVKEFKFLKKEFLTVGDYFNEGGETYTKDELLISIENDLGLDKPDGEILINKCVERGFIYDCGGEIYTR